jgi:hypothetical protein
MGRTTAPLDEDATQIPWKARGRPSYVLLHPIESRSDTPTRDNWRRNGASYFRCLTSNSTRVEEAVEGSVHVVNLKMPAREDGQIQQRLRYGIFPKFQGRCALLPCDPNLGRQHRTTM